MLAYGNYNLVLRGPSNLFGTPYEIIMDKCTPVYFLKKCLLRVMLCICKIPSLKLNDGGLLDRIKPAIQHSFFREAFSLLLHCREESIPNFV